MPVCVLVYWISYRAVRWEDCRAHASILIRPRKFGTLQWQNKGCHFRFCMLKKKVRNKKRALFYSVPSSPGKSLPYCQAKEYRLPAEKPVERNILIGVQGRLIQLCKQQNTSDVICLGLKRYKKSTPFSASGHKLIASWNIKKHFFSHL